MTPNPTQPETTPTSDKPARAISEILERSRSKSVPHLALFECGHTGAAWGERRGHCPVCPPVDNADTRAAWRNSRATYRARHPRKVRAHHLVLRAIKFRRLVAGPCEQCGSADTVAHHDDYARPLDVRWLCDAHHREWHRENGEGRNAA